MKEKELRKHLNCNLCKEKVLKGGLPLFWTVKIERHGVKIAAIQRQDGLTAFLGRNAILANIMGPDEEMTELMDSGEITVCEKCAIENPKAVFLLLEASRK